MSNKYSFLDRPDTSKSELQTFKAQGYETVIFVSNGGSCEECSKHNGEVYVIDELLPLDNPLFRTIHVNCEDSFTPYGKQQVSITTKEPEEQMEVNEPTNESPIMNQQIPLSQRI